MLTPSTWTPPPKAPASLWQRLDKGVAGDDTQSESLAVPCHCHIVLGCAGVDGDPLGDPPMEGAVRQGLSWCWARWVHLQGCSLRGAHPGVPGGPHPYLDAHLGVLIQECLSRAPHPGVLMQCPHSGAPFERCPFLDAHLGSPS